MTTTTFDKHGKQSQAVALPTATAREHRLRLFQPTRRPRAIETEIVTSWGRAVVSGRIGQAHADLLDAIMFCAERKAETSDGRIKILVDPAKVRRMIGVGGEQLEKLARELAEASIHIKDPKELQCIGHIIDHIDTACRSDGTEIKVRNPLGGYRAMWRVELGKALCKLIAKDAWVGYDPAPIAKLQYGISQAIARFVLSHKSEPDSGWYVDTLIKAVSGEIDEYSIRNRRREIRIDAERLAEMGVLVDKDKIKRQS